MLPYSIFSPSMYRVSELVKTKWVIITWPAHSNAANSNWSFVCRWTIGGGGFRCFGASTSHSVSVTLIIWDLRVNVSIQFTSRYFCYSNLIELTPRPLKCVIMFYNVFHKRMVPPNEPETTRVPSRKRMQLKWPFHTLRVVVLGEKVTDVTAFSDPHSARSVSLHNSAVFTGVALSFECEMMRVPPEENLMKPNGNGEEEYGSWNLRKYMLNW